MFYLDWILHSVMVRLESVLNTRWMPFSNSSLDFINSKASSISTVFRKRPLSGQLSLTSRTYSERASFKQANWWCTFPLTDSHHPTWQRLMHQKRIQFLQFPSPSSSFPPVPIFAFITFAFCTQSPTVWFRASQYASFLVWFMHATFFHGFAELPSTLGKNPFSLSTSRNQE